MFSTLTSRLLANSCEATSSFSFSWMASESLFWDFCIRNTMRNVTIVVPVLMKSCHASEYLKRGPVTAHNTTMESAVIKAQLLPAASVTTLENLSHTEGTDLILLA